MALKATTTTLILLLLATTLHAGDTDRYPGKGQGWLPPRTIYVFDATCQEYIDAAKEGGCIFNHFQWWAYGYLSGLNDSLPNGGNVLGGPHAQADEFMKKVLDYCVDHPKKGFYPAVSKVLGRQMPMDWKGDPQIR